MTRNMYMLQLLFCCVPVFQSVRTTSKVLSLQVRQRSLKLVTRMTWGKLLKSLYNDLYGMSSCLLLLSAMRTYIVHSLLLPLVWVTAFVIRLICQNLTYCLEYVYVQCLVVSGQSIKAWMPYSRVVQYGITVEGLPDGRTLKHPSSYGKTSLKKILQNRENIKVKGTTCLLINGNCNKLTCLRYFHCLLHMHLQTDLLC